MNTQDNNSPSAKPNHKCCLYIALTFGICLLIGLLALGWLAKRSCDEIKAFERAMAADMAADKDDKPSYETFVATHSFPYSAPSEKRERIVKCYGQLRVGLNRTEVAAILGEPDYSVQGCSKGLLRKYLGTCWTYYLEKPNPNSCNLKQDKNVFVAFDPTGKVHWVVSNIDGLKEIGKPGG